MAEGNIKHIEIEFESQRYLIRFTSHDEFMKKCREKFTFGQDEKIRFTLPGDDMEIDSECITDFPNGTALQLHKSRNDSQTKNVPGITSAIHQLTTGDSKEESRSHEVDGELGEDDFGSDEYMEDINWFKWGDDKALQDHLSVHGTKNIGSLLDDSLESWKRHSVNIAIIGQSGKGKSSLINALRGVDESGVRWAAVGETETTRNCTPYKDPKYDNIVYWDVPGCGTINFPRENYLQTINYQQYDYFLIVSSERFHETDIWLAKRLMSNKNRHRCYFIRSKVDIDVASRERRERKQNSNLSKNQLFSKFKVEVKTDIITALDDDTSIQLFLVSSLFPNEYEFQNLQLKLIEDALTEKRLSLAFGMNGLAKSLLDYKKRALRSRQQNVALRACIFTSESTSESAYFDGLTQDILHELQFYKQQLSLDDAGLQSVARTAGITVQALKVEFETDMSPAVIAQSLSKLSKRSSKMAGNTRHLTRQGKRAMSAVCRFLDGQLKTNIKVANTLIEYVKNRKEASAV